MCVILKFANCCFPCFDCSVKNNQVDPIEYAIAFASPNDSTAKSYDCTVMWFSLSFEPEEEIQGCNCSNVRFLKLFRVILPAFQYFAGLTLILCWIVYKTTIGNALITENQGRF